MNIDVNGINDKVKPKLKSCISDLEKVASSISKFDIPRDFAYYNKLKNMPQDIRNIKNDIDNVNKWVSGAAEKFQKAEKQNYNAINSLLGKLDNFYIASTAAKTGDAVATVAKSDVSDSNIMQGLMQKAGKSIVDLADNMESGIDNIGAEISSGWDSLYNTFLKPGVDFFKDCAANVASAVTGLLDKITDGIDKLINGITDFAQNGWEKMCDMKRSIDNAVTSAGAHLSSAWNSLTGDIIPKAWNAIKKTAASVSNIVISAVKGISQFVESLFDLLVIARTGVGSVFTGAYDGISYLIAKATGNESQWSSATSRMWKNTMSFVAEDWVGKAYDKFYKETAPGKWLDNNAWNWAKSNGIATEVASGLGYVAGIIVLTIATAGVGGAAVGASTTGTSAGIAALSGTGKYTQEAWKSMRDSSWEGIQRKHKNGEISDDAYNYMIQIRNLNDEEWAKIEENYQNGLVTDEEYSQMQYIRSIQGEWRTSSNAIKGIGSGVANGLWEGAQWYYGGKLASWSIEGHKVATAAVRVGADSVFNGADTGFRTIVDFATSDRNLIQAWDKQGGWDATLSNLIIGGVASAVSEGINIRSTNLKTNKVNEILNNNSMFKDLDEEIVEGAKEAFMKDVLDGKINIKKLSQAEIDDYLKAEIKRFTPKGYNYEKLGLRPDAKFGIEIEAFNVDAKNGLYKGTSAQFIEKRNWHMASKKEESLVNHGGAELVSPILRDTKTDWNSLAEICEQIKRYPGEYGDQVIADSKCGLHVHFDAECLVSDSTRMKNFLRLYAEAEELIYKMCNDVNNPIRKGAINRNYKGLAIISSLWRKGMASPNSKKLLKQIEKGTLKVSYKKFGKLKMIAAKGKMDERRYHGLNLTNIGNPKKNTIEFRMANGSLDPDVIRQNVYLYDSIIKTAIDMTDNPTLYEEDLKKFFRTNVTEEQKAKAFINLIMKDSEYRQIYLDRWKSVKDADVFANNSKKGFAQDRFIRETGAVSTEYSKIKTLASILLSPISYINKAFKKSLSKNTTLKNKAMREGILHFTSEESANAIISSGYIKKTGAIMSYGKPSTFFFSGVPTVDQVALNLDSVSKKMVAVKIKPTEESLSSFKYRHMDDEALLYAGDFRYRDFGLEAEKAYYILDETDGKLKYKEVSKKVFDSIDESQIADVSKRSAIGRGLAYQTDLILNNTAAQFGKIGSLIENTQAYFKKILNNK